MGTHIRVALALGSGGPRGLAHIGVIKALEEYEIPIDIIVGSSAGALIGGLYLALGSVSKLESYVKAVTYTDLAWMFLEFGAVSGIVRGDKITQYLERILEKKTIESLPKSFAAVATDLSTGLAVTLTSGLLSHAIRASGSIPVLIDAVHDNNKNLVDGGASCPVPVPIAREMGAGYVIAVNLDTYPFIQSGDSPRSPTVPDMGRAAIELLRYNLAQLLCREADCTITPDVSYISSMNLLQFVHGEEIIQKGYDAAVKELPHIRKDISR